MASDLDNRKKTSCRQKRNQQKAVNSPEKNEIWEPVQLPRQQKKTSIGPRKISKISG